jgi:hypothetical protein
MKKYICILLTFLTLQSYAQAKVWGVGAVFGAPTGLSADYFFKDDRVLHSTLAYNLDGKSNIAIASHYEWRKNYRNLNWFYGAGGKIVLNDFCAGPAGSLGIFHDFKEAPVEIFLKTALTLNIISKTSSDLDLMLGIHYQF